MADLIIRNGTIVDGTGAPAVRGDVEVTDGVITAVGEVDGTAARELDADGALVTPGFIDIHTHFDGQATWDPVMAPSSLHGVTTVAMGNCGVGFAPAAPDRHDWLISLLEGVEDIPGTALAEGLTWDWETFPEYLDALEAKPHTVDVAAHLPHAALRTYVMGERGADHTEAPTDAELAEMARQVREAIAAGAMGFATSRTEIHRTSAGQNIGTLTADERELLDDRPGDGRGRRRGHPADQRPLPDPRRRGRPARARPARGVRAHQRSTAELHDAAGVPLARALALPDGLGRPHGRRRPGREGPGRLPADRRAAGLQTSANPFAFCASMGELGIFALPDRVAALRDPERKRRILAEHAELAATLEPGIVQQIMCGFDVIFRLTDPVDYELDADWCVAAEARAQGPEPADADLRPAAGARRHPAALPAAVQLRPRQLRRHPRDDHRAQHAVRPVRRRRPLRCDLRRVDDHLVARGVEP